MIKTKAQSTIEFVLLMIIILAAFLTMQSYIKRGLQGRWKGAVDELGDQYDPRLMNSLITDSYAANSITQVRVIQSRAGSTTNRSDQSNSIEKRTGISTVGWEY